MYGGLLLSKSHYHQMHVSKLMQYKHNNNGGLQRSSSNTIMAPAEGPEASEEAEYSTTDMRSFCQVGIQKKV